MNISIFIRTPATGGLEKQALELYSLLSDHGHNVNFIYVYSTPSFISPGNPLIFLEIPHLYLNIQNHFLSSPSSVYPFV